MYEYKKSMFIMEGKLEKVVGGRLSTEKKKLFITLGALALVTVVATIVLITVGLLFRRYKKYSEKLEESLRIARLDDKRSTINNDELCKTIYQQSDYIEAQKVAFNEAQTQVNELEQRRNELAGRIHTLSTTLNQQCSLVNGENGSFIGSVAKIADGSIFYNPSGRIDMMRRNPVTKSLESQVKTCWINRNIYYLYCIPPSGTDVNSRIVAIPENYGHNAEVFEKVQRYAAYNPASLLTPAQIRQYCPEVLNR